MILFVLCITAFLFFICFNLLTNHKVLHVITSVVFAVLFILSTFFITINFHDHYGMHKVSYEKTSKLAPVGSNDLPFIIAQAPGTSGKDKVVVYRSDDKATKPTTTSTDKVENKIITINSNKAKLVTKTVKYEYNSSANRLWFRLAQKPTRVKTVNYFYIPKSWMVLNKNQVNELKKMQSSLKPSKEQQAQMKMAAEQYVQAKVKAAMMKNPKMTSAQQKSLVKKATTEFTKKTQAEAIQKMMPEIKQKLSQVK
ncbi:DUF4811 domain-containing protein [Apilactobacillus nanyangensis]|uniref:DUF4811 domain-containing protein n=1 Tax=Apilactobacillus nanyangensis TaxID=2799579 RepID=UPI001942820B|nr:DUF4811 domain-containing protein [Apilactobacillus nanyangensis]